jgi:cell wall integrity and stress response component
MRLNHRLMVVIVQSSFQSNGACRDTCSSDYAYAVVQGQDCWCSDFAPGYSVNTLRCSQPCPGYPSDWCGSSSSGLYAYFQLTRSPSGTAARSSAQPSRTLGSSVSGPLTTETPNLSTFLGPSNPLSVTSQVEASSSVSPALTVITIQSTVPASSEQPTVTVTEEAPPPSSSSSV